MKLIATNSQALHNYFVEDTFECGIVLQGSEVKSIRQGGCNLKDTFALISKNNELILKNMYIKPYEKATAFVPNARVDRKLLAHSQEIKKMLQKVSVKGYTLVPIKLYFKGSLVKVELGLCKGKHTFDKKDVLKQKDINRDVERTIKNYMH